MATKREFTFDPGLKISFCAPTRKERIDALVAEHPEEVERLGPLTIRIKTAARLVIDPAPRKHPREANPRTYVGPSLHFPE